MKKSVANCIFTFLILVATPLPSIAHTVDRATIKMTVEKSVRILNPRTRAFGSGVIIKPGNLILTANHVVAENVPEPLKEILTFNITFDDGSLVSANLLYADTTSDLAILKLNSDKLFSYVELGDIPTRDNRGDDIFAIGSPFMQVNQVFKGNISSWLMVSEQEVIMLAIKSIPGMSGGGVFDSGGKLIGIMKQSLISSKTIRIPGQEEPLVYSAHLGVAISIKTIIRVFGSKVNF